MAGARPTVSVIVACASLRDPPAETLLALEDQDYAGDVEILLVLPEGLQLPSAARSGIRVIRTSQATIPALRTAGWRAAGGDYVGVLACYCVPPPSWVRDAVDLLESQPGLRAVGGPVRAGVRRGADLAGFLCEYGQIHAENVTTGNMPLPGLNVIYRRAVLAAAAEETLRRSFWEESLHELLDPAAVRVDARLAVALKRSFDLGWYSKQRYWYSRHYAGGRFLEQPGRRWAYRLLLPLLHPLLLARILMRDPGDALRVLPQLYWFTLVWTVGELAGAWAGPGAALERVE